MDCPRKEAPLPGNIHPTRHVYTREFLLRLQRACTAKPRKNWDQTVGKLIISAEDSIVSPPTPRNDTLSQEIKVFSLSRPRQQTQNAKANTTPEDVKQSAPAWKPQRVVAADITKDDKTKTIAAPQYFQDEENPQRSAGQGNNIKGKLNLS
ncbi:hypothetical protein K470DRAFT_267692 [Piedraia hortae CBS 480.64]|uniref:Uncharacterized protein n=1 Tax=Piedraia hortae CBS 480.64 TaxID=1314780 RepID=A0A6A7C9N3_9PEZI|nr:hypothetical protein K470DRAFT_267692 [Piedraia hortae CBS 480.64]